MESPEYTLSNMVPLELDLFLPHYLVQIGQYLKYNLLLLKGSPCFKFDMLGIIH